jgi:hypothetical protein
VPMEALDKVVVMPHRGVHGPPPFLVVGPVDLDVVLNATLDPVAVRRCPLLVAQGGDADSKSLGRERQGSVHRLDTSDAARPIGHPQTPRCVGNTQHRVGDALAAIRVLPAPGRERPGSDPATSDSARERPGSDSGTPGAGSGTPGQ